MKTVRMYSFISLPVCLLLLAFFTNPKQTASFVPVKAVTLSEGGLFESDEPLQITLKGNIKELFKDRVTKPKLFPIVLSYKNDDGSEVTMPIQARTRGHFRRLSGNCNFPPLLLQFNKEGDQQGTVFSEQHKLKLVMPCSGDEYVIREWLTYKMYNLFTPISFRARLVKVMLEDERNKKAVDPFYGILLEEEKQMAKRNDAVAIEKKMQPQQIKTDAFFRMSVFQYLIGNTDWSIQYQQNIKLVTQDSGRSIIAVPYDFDHAGIVNAPYANPAVELQMNSIRQRRFRGYCVQDMNVYNDVLAEFMQHKDEIYNLFSGCALLDQKFVKSNMRWLDEFYNTINNQKAWHNDFAYPCDKKGTGNVVIKGLKED